MNKVIGKKRDLGNGLIVVDINREALSQQGSTLQEVFQNAMRAFDKKEKKQNHLKGNEVA